MKEVTKMIIMTIGTVVVTILGSMVLYTGLNPIETQDIKWDFKGHTL